MKVANFLGKRTTSAAQASSHEIPDADECANKADASGPLGVSNAVANGGIAQSASGGCSRPVGSIAGAPLSSYSVEDQKFYSFWYGHMLNDLMQPPLSNISHATARYIWDAARVVSK